MEKRRIGRERELIGSRTKALFLLILSIVVASSLVLYAFTSGSFDLSLVLVIVACILLAFFAFFAIRRYRDAKRGIPFEDERSRRVMEKAGYGAFLITLYVLLAVGLLSDDLVHFRDVSQATSAVIGIMALVFFGAWFYYNRKGI